LFCIGHIPKLQILKWSGFAFEAVCMKHISQIIKRLNLDSLGAGIGRSQFIPQKGSKEKGAQSDLIIDRFDNRMNVCDIIFSNEQYRINKNDARNLANKSF